MKSDMNSSRDEDIDEKKGIPLKWIFYAVLIYAFLQTLYFWWQVRGE